MWKSEIAQDKVGNIAFYHKNYKKVRLDSIEIDIPNSAGSKV
jgi:hypothetical protein